jgi:hypothetical protein
MKTWLIVALLVFANTLTSFAQGVVNFNNNVLTPPPDRTVYLSSSGTPVVGTNFVAQLYWSTDGGTCFTSVTAAPARFRPAGTSPAGTWLGGNRTLPAGVGGVGVTIQLMVLVWDVFNPSSIGNSASFNYTQSLSSPPAASDTYMKNFVGGDWSLSPQLGFQGPAPSQFCIVPESTAALLLLPGFAALWLLRRSRNQ